METKNDNSNSASGPSTGLREFIIAKEAKLYHGTSMKEVAIKAIQLDTNAFDTPAYFKTYPNNLYGPKSLVFKATADIHLIDLANPETVKLLYRSIVADGAVMAAQALALKSGATIQDQQIVALGKWKTASAQDDALAQWVKSQGKSGWRIPFTDNEIMLTTMKGLVCEGKHKWL